MDQDEFPGVTDEQLNDWNIHNDHADNIESDDKDSGVVETVLEHEVKDMGLKMVCRYLGRGLWHDPAIPFDKWRCDLRNPANGARISVTYHIGYGLHGARPQIVDVVENLLEDAIVGAMPYNEFLKEFGYEDDKDKRKMWRTCWRGRGRLMSFFGPVTMGFLINRGQQDWEEYERERKERARY